MVTVPTSSGCRFTNASTSFASAGCPIRSATSNVKKSQGSRNLPTVFRLMWSASRKYGFVQPSSLTAASAAARVWLGSEPIIMCSRLDLFHTGTTSTPASAARMHAASCALAWCANLSPTPNENFGSFNPSLIKTLLIFCLIGLTNFQLHQHTHETSLGANRLIFEATFVGPEAEARVRDVEDLLAVHRVPTVCEGIRVVLLQGFRQIAILVVDALDLLAGQMSRAV